MKRIFLHRFDYGACAYYRARLPHRHCSEPLKTEGIELTCSHDLKSVDDYDAFVFKVITSHFLPVYQEMKEKGKKLVINLDDDLWHLPEWNPAAKYHGPEVMKTVGTTLDLADEIWTSTEPLAQVVRDKGQGRGWGDKVKVLPNLIDPSDYPEPTKRDDGKVRVLWAGSVHHDEDIALLVPVVEELAKKYPDKVEFLFFGSFPDALCDWVKIKNTNLAAAVPRKDLRHFLKFVDAVDLSEYPATLCALGADIALCPLVDVPFNHSKSGIKSWECALAGCFVVASSLPPYEDAPMRLRMKADGHDTGRWVGAVNRNITEPVGRAVWQERFRAIVHRDHSWQSPAMNLWMNAFRGLAS